MLTYFKIKRILKHFFNSSDQDKLQKIFIDNYDYPTTMTLYPVRYNNRIGEIYYIINLKSKEFYDNEHTKEIAYSNSLKFLNDNLPLGVTNYITPNPIEFIEEHNSFLCSFSINRPKFIRFLGL